MPEMPEATKTPFVDTRKYETVTDPQAFEGVGPQARMRRRLHAGDTETSSIDRFSAHLVGPGIQRVAGRGRLTFPSAIAIPEPPPSSTSVRSSSG
jgi:hypothetical protein